MGFIGALFGAVWSLVLFLSHYVTATLEALLLPLGLSVVHRGLVPDIIIRLFIRLGLLERILDLRKTGVEQAGEAKMKFIEDLLHERPIAEETDAANEQHYMVPPEFFELCLGPHRKYSCGHWPREKMTLAESEEEALALVCQRAGLRDGMHVLDLGCGWGSFSLYAARHFPNCKITAVSNSSSQRKSILARAEAAGIGENLEVITADANELELTPGTFDRAITIEMFEHLKAYGQILENISTWLKPEGKLFVHIFCHSGQPYHFEDGWMARTFFTGGQMPSSDLLLYFQQHMSVAKHWRVSGMHYHRTCEAWLQKMDAHRKEALPILARAYGAGLSSKSARRAKANEWFANWRLFYLACSELFRWGGGERWGVSHYLFENRSLATSARLRRSGGAAAR
mmetsp:Transcript_10275/g.24581  ORF Transcript_10275/g.24581 Transcript_10275/m.24581 type:complete len:399 (-) Transcript_10275:109-1305(-)